jgi:hypothetical protein
MRESQMKKIIAVAIAGAFIAPAVHAAEVTLGGEIEYYITDATGGTTGNTAENEIKVSVTEELDNGMTISGYLNSNNGGTHDSGIAIASDFGTLNVGNGDGDTAITAMDDKADVAEQGAGAGSAGTGKTYVNTVRFTPNLGVEGLTVSAGYAVGAAATDETSDFALQYSVAGFAVSYGEAEVEGSTVTTKNTSVSYTYGPFYAAMDSVDGKNGVENAKVDAVAVTYNYGPGNIFVETNEVNYTSATGNAVLSGTANLKPKTTVVGISYKIGGLNTYIQTLNADSGTGAATETDTTYVGVEYAF